MDEFAEKFDSILDKGKQQGSEMLKKTLNARQNLHGTIPVSSDVQQKQCDPQLPTSNQPSTLLNTIHPSQAVTQEKCEDCSPMDAIIINLSNGFTVKAVTRLCKTQFVKRKTIANYDDCIKRMKRSGKHTIRSDSKDFATVLNKLVVEGAFEFKEGRSLNCFPAMSGDPLNGLDIHSLYNGLVITRSTFDKKAR